MCQISIKNYFNVLVKVYPIFILDTACWVHLVLCNELLSYTFMCPLQCKYTSSTASYTVKWANTKSILSANAFSDYVLKCTLSTNAPFKSIVCHFSKRDLKWSNFPHNFIHRYHYVTMYVTKITLQIIRWKCYKLATHYSNTSF